MAAARPPCPPDPAAPPPPAGARAVPPATPSDGAGALGAAYVRRAAAELQGRVVRTPVVRCDAVDELAGARVWLKAENLQHAGSYKTRGALLALQRLLDREGRVPGVAVQSTGNHALAMARAARELGVPLTAVLPRLVPAAKVEQIEALGGHVVRTGSTVAERQAVVDRVAAERGYAVIDAYDHPDVVLGQGTATHELVEQVAEAGHALDAVVVPVGGGGGLAGACLATSDRPSGRAVAVHGASPAGCESLACSLLAGRPVPVAPAATVADGLRVSRVGDLPFAIARRRAPAVHRVHDDQVVAAVRVLLAHAKLVVEPSGAAALAAVLAGTVAGADIGVLLTGGNVDPASLLALVGPARPLVGPIGG